PESATGPACKVRLTGPAVVSIPTPKPHPHKETTMSIARVTEISSTSTQSFDDAIQQGVARATKTLRNVKSAWIKEQRVDIRDGKIAEYQVNMMVTFILDD